MSDLLPYSMIADPWVTGILTTALVLVLASVAMCTGVIRLQAQSVFAPLGSRKSSDRARMQDTYAGSYLLWACTVGVAVGITILATYVMTDVRVSPLDLVIRVLFFVAFLAFRRLMLGLTNWTFFADEAIHRWACVYRLKMVVDALLMLLSAQIVVTNELSTVVAIVIAISAAIPGFVLLMWGTWRLFFGNLLGCLHFLLYLCTLELLLTLMAVHVQIELTMPTWWANTLLTD